MMFACLCQSLHIRCFSSTLPHFIRTSAAVAVCVHCTAVCRIHGGGRASPRLLCCCATTEARSTGTVITSTDVKAAGATATAERPTAAGAVKSRDATERHSAGTHALAAAVGLTEKIEAAAETGGGPAEGGPAEGGPAEGGSAEGGSAEGGPAEGGPAEGGPRGGGPTAAAVGAARLPAPDVTARVNVRRSTVNLWDCAAAEKPADVGVGAPWNGKERACLGQGEAPTHGRTALEERTLKSGWCGERRNYPKAYFELPRFLRCFSTTEVRRWLLRRSTAPVLPESFLSQTSSRTVGQQHHEGVQQPQRRGPQQPGEPQQQQRVSLRVSEGGGQSLPQDRHWQECPPQHQLQQRDGVEKQEVQRHRYDEATQQQQQSANTQPSAEYPRRRVGESQSLDASGLKEGAQQQQQAPSGPTLSSSAFSSVENASPSRPTTGVATSAAPGIAAPVRTRTKATGELPTRRVQLEAANISDAAADEASGWRETEKGVCSFSAFSPPWTPARHPSDRRRPAPDRQAAAVAAANKLLAQIQALEDLSQENGSADRRQRIDSSSSGRTGFPRPSPGRVLQLLAEYDALLAAQAATTTSQGSAVHQPNDPDDGLGRESRGRTEEAATPGRTWAATGGRRTSTAATPTPIKGEGSPIYDNTAKPLPVTLSVSVLKCFAKYSFPAGDPSSQTMFYRLLQRVLAELRQATVTLVTRFESTCCRGNVSSGALYTTGDVDPAGAVLFQEEDEASVNQQARHLLHLLLSTVESLCLLQQQQPQLVREALQLFYAVLLLKKPTLCQSSRTHDTHAEEEGLALMSDADLEAAARACECTAAVNISSPELLDLLLHPLIFRRLSLANLAKLLDAVRVEANPRHVQQLRDQLPLEDLLQDIEPACGSAWSDSRNSESSDSGRGSSLREGEAPASERDWTVFSGSNAYDSSAVGSVHSSNRSGRTCDTTEDGSGSKTQLFGDCTTDGDMTSRTTSSNPACSLRRSSIRQTTDGTGDESGRLSQRSTDRGKPVDSDFAGSFSTQTSSGARAAEMPYTETRRRCVDRTRIAAEAFAALTSVVDVDTHMAEELLQRLELPLRRHLKGLDCLTLAKVQRGVRLLISSKEAALRSGQQQDFSPSPPVSAADGEGEDACCPPSSPTAAAAPRTPAPAAATAEAAAPVSAGAAVQATAAASRIYQTESAKKRAFFYPRGAGDTLRLRRQTDMYSSLLALLGVLYRQLEQRLLALERKKKLSTLSSVELLTVAKLLPGTYFDSFPHHRGKILRLRLLLWKILRKLQPVRTMGTTQLLQQIQLLLVHSLYSSDPGAFLEHAQELDVRQRPDLLHTESQRQLAAAVRVAIKMDDLQEEAKSFFAAAASKVLLAALCQPTFPPGWWEMGQGAPRSPLFPVPSAPLQRQLGGMTPAAIAASRRVAGAGDQATRVHAGGRTAVSSALWEGGAVGVGSAAASFSDSGRLHPLQPQTQPRPQQGLPHQQDVGVNRQKRREQDCEKGILPPLAALPRGKNAHNLDVTPDILREVMAGAPGVASQMVLHQAEQRRRRVRFETLVDTTAALQRSGTDEQKQMWGSVATFYVRHSKPVFESLLQPHAQQRASHPAQTVAAAAGSSSVQCDGSNTTAAGGGLQPDRTAESVPPAVHTSSLSKRLPNSVTWRPAAGVSSLVAADPGVASAASQRTAVTPAAASAAPVWLPASLSSSAVGRSSVCGVKDGRGSQGASTLNGPVDGVHEENAFRAGCSPALGMWMSGDAVAITQECEGFDVSSLTHFSLCSRVLRRRLLLLKEQLACKEQRETTPETDILTPAAAAVAVLKAAWQQQRQRDATEFMRWLRCGILLLQHSLSGCENESNNTNAFSAATAAVQELKGRQTPLQPLQVQADSNSGRLVKWYQEEMHCNAQQDKQRGAALHRSSQPQQQQQQLAQLVFEALLENPQVEGSAGKVSLLEMLPHGMIAEALYAFCCMRYHKTHASSFSQLLTKLPAPLVPVDGHVAMLLWKAYTTLLQEGSAAVRWRFSRFTHDSLNPLAWAAKASPAQLEDLFRPYKMRCQTLFSCVAAALQQLSVQFTPWPPARETDGLPLAFIVHLRRGDFTQIENSLFSPSSFNTHTQRQRCASSNKERDATPPHVRVPSLHPGSLRCPVELKGRAATNVFSCEDADGCSNNSTSPVSHVPQLQLPTPRRGDHEVAETPLGGSSTDFDTTSCASPVRARTLRVGVLLIPSGASAVASADVCKKATRGLVRAAGVRGETVTFADNTSTDHCGGANATLRQHVHLHELRSASHLCSYAPRSSAEAVSVLTYNKKGLDLVSTGGDASPKAHAPGVFLCKGKNEGEQIAAALRAKGWKRLVCVTEEEWHQQDDTLRRVLLAARLRSAAQPRGSKRKD